MQSLGRVRISIFDDLARGDNSKPRLERVVVAGSEAGMPVARLLVEAISGPSSETRVASTQTKEVAHEQDHA